MKIRSLFNGGLAPELFGDFCYNSLSDAKNKRIYDNSSMIKLFFIFSCVMLLSCSDHRRLPQTIKGDTFVNEPATYNLKNGKLMVREFEDGTLVYGVSDKLNRLQYQQSIFQPFSDHQYWTIYLDKEENIWFYCGDLQQLEEIKYDENIKAYIFQKVSDKTILPNAFLKELNKEELTEKTFR